MKKLNENNCSLSDEFLGSILSNIPNLVFMEYNNSKINGKRPHKSSIISNVKKEIVHQINKQLFVAGFENIKSFNNIENSQRIYILDMIDDVLDNIRR